jgi:DNA-binding NtrC family response regulator
MPINTPNSEHEMSARNPDDRLLIIDDDICFGALMSAIAPKYQLKPRFFPSLVDMGSFARIRDFDIAVIDYFLGHLRGDEIAEYVDTFFDDIPVIIVSAEESLSHRQKVWPESVRMFLPKNVGPDSIAAAVRRVLTRERFLNKLKGTSHDNFLDHGS